MIDSDKHDIIICIVNSTRWSFQYRVSLIKALVNENDR